MQFFPKEEVFEICAKRKKFGQKANKERAENFQKSTEISKKIARARSSSHLLSFFVNGLLLPRLNLKSTRARRSENEKSILFLRGNTFVLSLSLFSLSSGRKEARGEQ